MNKNLHILTKEQIEAIKYKQLRENYNCFAKELKIPKIKSFKTKESGQLALANVQVQYLEKLIEGDNE